MGRYDINGLIVYFYSFKNIEAKDKDTYFWNPCFPFSYIPERNESECTNVAVSTHNSITTMAQMAHFSFPYYFTIPNSEFRIPKFELRISEFGIVKYI